MAGFNETDGYPVNCPCKGCQERELGCHGNCQAYVKYRKDLDEFNKKRQREINKYNYGLRCFKRRRRR